MVRSWSLLLPLALALVASAAHAAIVEHTFNVGNLSISQLCQPNRIITAVNGQLPGPTIRAREGDTVVVHLVNESPYSMTIHWHGIFQRGSQWADGPAMVTQCPFQPGGNYTYSFNVTGQEGTLWWHAHFSFLRATVYGALIILPRGGAKAYPFAKPDKEEVIMFGEWWNANVFDLQQMALLTGIPAGPADAYTINDNSMRNLCEPIRKNETYLLRIINAALNTPLFFKVANHSFTVVAADACYTTPYKTDVVVVGPGQTVDALMVADAAVGRYYMAASPYDSGIPSGPPFSKTNATAVLEYAGGPNTTLPPALPQLPQFNDTDTADRTWVPLQPHGAGAPRQADRATRGGHPHVRHRWDGRRRLPAGADAVQPEPHHVRVEHEQRVLRAAEEHLHARGPLQQRDGRRVHP
uniref:laccase n=1 Tax=Aegilops tauschii subsp. strangulata TaxID=200361 RepID=A0A452XQ06_AEGTS